MKNGGYILLHRKAFQDELAQPSEKFSMFEAWVWLLCAAGYEGEDRGIVRTSLRCLASAWGWTHGDGKNAGKPNAMAVKRVLEAWEADNRISVKNVTVLLQKPYSQCYKNVTGPRAETTIITILNYGKYQEPGKRRHTGNVTKMLQPVLQESGKLVTGSPSSSYRTTKEIKNHDSANSAESPSYPRSVRMNKATKNKEILSLKIDILAKHLSGFRAKWGSSGVDVDKAFLGFKKRVLTGTPAKPFPNPHNWRWFDRAFDEWCEKAIEYGQAIKANEPEDAGLPEY